MKKSPFLYLSILAAILVALFFLTSCSKSNVTLKHHWKVQEGQDRTTYNHAAFCFAEDYGKIDTIELDNTAAYDSTKFGMHVGSIYFHPGYGENGRMPTDDPSIFDRKYCDLLEQID